MKIHFSIEYNTRWGEDLRVHVEFINKEGVRQNNVVCPMETFDGKTWDSEITFNAGSYVSVEYKYAMYRNDELVWTEWSLSPHSITLDAVTESYLVNDYWRPIPDDLPLFSSAYTEGVGYHEDVPVSTCYQETLQLRVVEPRLRKNQYLAVCGNVPQLGSWARPVRMTKSGKQEWLCNVDASILYNQVEYKYVITNENGNILSWEKGANRKIKPVRLFPHQMWIKTDTNLDLELAKWKTAGVVIPVFSLRTSNSYGVGDFGDLKKMIDWAEKVDMHVIQILPVNDTTTTGQWTDSYPYNAISVYALHPIYCDLSSLPKVKDNYEMERFLMRQHKLNRKNVVDYEKVYSLKMSYLRMIYEQERQAVFDSDSFKTYLSDNAHWLPAYALFCFFRDKYGTADFHKWEHHGRYDKEELEQLMRDDEKVRRGVGLYMYIQYCLHNQLTDAHQYARSKGVIIKGDIPIGICRTSVETWTDPELFNIDCQAGAPPDNFSANGQNWGFPTYNWELMRKDGYAWWRNRLRKMSEFFDAYRIDHVLGFFRIWEIPVTSVNGLLGQFSPSLPMSVNEIEKYGIRFQKDLMTKPVITEDLLDNIFGYRKDVIKSVFLYRRTDGRYDLREEYNTQRKIEHYFAGRTGDENIAIRNGLYEIVDSVLFIPDRQNHELYHPRIAAQGDYAFQMLTIQEREAFNRLYDDFYYRRHNDFWYEEAMRKLPVLTQSTDMLCCAEDLGMVPSCVPLVLDSLRILSLEIQTMPKKEGMEFGLLHDNPYRSVATISTHDMSPLRLWWKEDYQRAQRFYKTALHKDGKAPADAPSWLCEEIVSRHLFSPSVMCLLSFQDWTSMDESVRSADIDGERINVPSEPRHYWRYRMHIEIEKLLEADNFNDKIRKLIEISGRN